MRKIIVLLGILLTIKSLSVDLYGSTNSEHHLKQFTTKKNAKGYIDLRERGEGTYQDIIINGEVVEKGTRDCTQRYEIIKRVLNQYKRPITVLDIGASQGYFSFRIASEYPSVCTMIEGNFKFSDHVAEQLQNLCELNTDLDNIIYLQKHISIEDLEKLSECEHFDVVLMLSVLHHMGEDWKKATDLAFSLGDNLIIETPPSDDPIALSNKTVIPLEKYLYSKEYKEVTKTERHPDYPHLKASMFWFSTPKNHIICKSLDDPLANGQISIISDFEKKFLVGKDGVLRPWITGINLRTFEALNGIFPYNSSRFNKLDITKYNQPIIIQGKKVVNFEKSKIESDNFQPTFTEFFSQNDQDKFIYEHFFKSKKHPGIFIEVGANNGLTYSNTYFFEKELNWRGMCIEPLPHVFEELQKNRPGSICINGCIANQPGKTQFLSINGYSEMLSGILGKYDPRHLERIENELNLYGGEKQIIEVPCYRLNDLLDKHKINHVDYLSIDTEGNEFEILQSIDFTIINIEIISIENNYNESYIRNFLEKNGYQYITQQGRDDIYQKIH